MASVLLANILTDPSLPDSLYEWQFRANVAVGAAAADSWTGTLVANSGLYVSGDTVAGAAGVYTIVAVTPQGADLTGFGREDGEVFVTSYWDGGTGSFLPTRNGPSIVSGTAGLGSEQDAAWNWREWVTFGRGGLDQANAVDVQAAQFTWSFQADGGDTMAGSMTAAARDYAPGDTIRGAAGTYTILTETEPAPSEAEPIGTIRITSYWDASSRSTLALQGEATWTGSAAGLGTESDHAWNGEAWINVGGGGQRQADRVADTLFTWRFTATTGDYYGGLLWASGAALDAGSSWTTANGTYRILAEAARPDLSAVAPGTVWVTGYVDAESGQALPTWYWDFLAMPTTALGLGQEVDAAWDGDEFDLFGRGGALLASVELYSQFFWTFEADSGDRWTGSLWANSQAYQPGDIIAASHGRYLINREVARGSVSLVPEGTVWVADYTDAVSGRTYSTWYWGVEQRSAQGNGLGSEVDAAWTGYDWQVFGQGGARQVNVVVFSLYSFTFHANSGDRWTGSLWADSTLYEPGSVVTSAHGRYVIGAETPRDPNPAIADGTIWIDSYHDQRSGALLTTWNWGALRQASQGRFLGNEVEAAWTGYDWQVFGSGGALQVDVKTFSQYFWTFEANSGDRWSGSLWADSTLYDAGSIIATANGRYLILNEVARPPSSQIADGTVWVGSYYDAETNQTFGTWYWGVQQGPAAGRFLGNEVEAAWTGYDWQVFGKGGASQVDVKTFSQYFWTFEANSGDRWSGSLWADSTLYDAGSIIATANGRYLILNEVARPPSSQIADGTVWVGSYYDAETNQTFGTWYWGVQQGPAAGRFLGNEVEAAWTGYDWQVFGNGGARQVDVKNFAIFVWTFIANSGDSWTGRLYADRDAYSQYQVITTGHGRYSIEEAIPVAAVAGRAEGTTWVDSYYDAQSARRLTTWSASQGQPVQTLGLGQEVDAATTGTEWIIFGQGGAQQVTGVGAAADLLG